MKKKEIITKQKESNIKKEEPNKVIEDLCKNVTKEHGKESAMVIGTGAKDVNGVCSSGIATFDVASGIGGVAYGKLIVIASEPNVGKTHMALHLAAECQQMGGVVMYQDAEYKMNPGIAEVIGVDMDSLILSHPPYLEKSLEIMEATIKDMANRREETGEQIPIMIILDSMSASLSKSEFEGEYTDKHVSPQARAMSLGLKKLIPLCAKEMVSLVFISQLRDKVETGYGKYPNKSTVTGCGKSPRFYSVHMCELKVRSKIKKNDEHIGNDVECLFSKNQLGIPFKKADFRIIFGHGIDKTHALLEQAVIDGVVEQSGGYYSCTVGGKELKKHGADIFIRWMNKDEKLKQYIYNKVYGRFDNKK